MNKIIFSVLAVFIVVDSVFAGGQKIIVPKYDEVSVFKNMPRLLNETPVFKVNVSDHLKVLDANECCFYIVDTKGRNGWVEKSQCNSASIARTMKFESATVQGINELYSPLVVFGNNQADIEGLNLDRSFRENLRDNVDREEITRIADKTGQ